MPEGRDFDLLEGISALISAKRNEINHLEKLEQEYRTLGDFLEDVVQDVRKGALIPISELAYIPGELIHTNEFIILCGENWFVEKSQKGAKELLGRRLRCIEQKLNELKIDVSELTKKSSLAGLVLGADSQRFPEIIDEYKEEDNPTECEENDEEDEMEESCIVYTKDLPNVLRKDMLDDFDKKLLESLSGLEEEENIKQKPLENIQKSSKKVSPVFSQVVEREICDFSDSSESDGSAVSLSELQRDYKAKREKMIKNKVLEGQFQQKSKSAGIPVVASSNNFSTHKTQD